MARIKRQPAKQPLPRITDSFVERVARPQKGADFYFDKGRTGFGVKIYPPNQNTNKPSKRVYGVRVTIEGNKKRWITIGPHGKQWTATKAEAEAGKIRWNIENGLPPFHHRAEKKAALYRLKDLAKTFFEDFEARVKQGIRSETTCSAYKRQWNRNVPNWLKNTEVASLKGSLFKKALKEISFPKGKPHRKTEGNRTLAMLSSMLSWVMDQDEADRMGLKENFCTPVKRNKQPKSIGIWMEDAQQARLMTFLSDPNNRHDQWWEAERQARREAKRNGIPREELWQPPYLLSDQMAHALTLLFISGLRSWEVMALRWDTIHARSQTISVLQTKLGANPGVVGETKRIYISEEVQAVLDQIPEVSEWVFPTTGTWKKSKSGHMENMQDSWERVREHLSLPMIRLHDYRHTAASEAGDHPAVSVKDLQAAFGWKTEQTANRYLHSREKARDLRMQDVTTQRMNRLTRADATVPERESPPPVRKKPGKKRKPSERRAPTKSAEVEKPSARQKKTSVKEKAR